MQATATVENIEKVIENVPFLEDAATASSEVYQFTETNNEGSLRVKKRLTQLGKLQRKRKRFEDEGGVVLPAGYDEQCDAVSNAFSRIANAYSDADTELSHLIEMLDDAVEKEAKKIKSETEEKKEE